MLMHRSTHTRTNSTKIVNTSKHRKQKSHPFTSQPNVRTRITKEEQEDVREAFEIFDTDKDGMLDTFEFRSALRMLGIRLGSSELERIMLGVGQRLDHHPTELFITFENYYYHAVHYLLKLPPNYQIQDTFRMLDVNGRGGITAMDLLRAVRELGISMDEEEAHRMIQEFDGDQDGQVTEAEYNAIIQKATCSL